MKIAIITGASSGLGRAFVRRLGRDTTLDAIWAIARNEANLHALAALSAVPVRALPMDLTDADATARLTALLAAEKPSVDVLICAAGFGKIAKTAELPPDEQINMIDLNCRAAVAVTAACLPYVRKGSRILEICSTAAFQPMPRLGVYAASKAFLQSYTKTLHHELLCSGVHVTAVCPYWIKDTGFIPRAQGNDRHSYGRFFLASRADTIARWALVDSRLNLWVSTPGPVCAIHRLVAKFVPHFIMVPLMELLRHVI